GLGQPEQRVCQDVGPRPSRIHEDRRRVQILRLLRLLDVHRPVDRIERHDLPDLAAAPKDDVSLPRLRLLFFEGVAVYRGPPLPASGRCRTGLPAGLRPWHPAAGKTPTIPTSLRAGASPTGSPATAAPLLPSSSAWRPRESRASTPPPSPPLAAAAPPEPL